MDIRLTNTSSPSDRSQKKFYKVIERHINKGAENFTGEGLLLKPNKNNMHFHLNPSAYCLFIKSYNLES